MTASTRDLIQGTLDLIVLKALAVGPLHGWAVAQRIQTLSDNVFRVNQGSLYPALHRLEGRGLIDADWGVIENGRRTRIYRLTAAGRRRLARETEDWLEYTRGLRLLLNAN